MDNIRQNIVGGINREHLVTKQDIHNIKNYRPIQYNTIQKLKYNAIIKF